MKGDQKMSDESSDKTVVVLGASDKPDRYSNKAVKSLAAYGCRVIPVHPVLPEIEGFKAAAALGDIKEAVHTLTMYVAPWRSDKLSDDILALNPGRVIFNPGSENPALEKLLKEQGVEVLRACTLVMLSTGQF